MQRYISVLCRVIIGLLLSTFLTACVKPEQAARSEIRITLDANAAQGIADLGLEVPVVGRAFVVISRDGEEEPRLGSGVTGNPLWGIDVRGYAAGDSVVISDGTDTVSGYPFESTAALPPGNYFAQAFLNVYTTFKRADGHVVEAHLNSGAFQSPFEAPGNAHSAVQQISVRDDGLPSMDFVLDSVIQPPQPLKDGEVLQQGNFDDTEWVRYFKIKSEKLSQFWGRDMYIGANILLPAGYMTCKP